VSETPNLINPITNKSFNRRAKQELASVVHKFIDEVYNQFGARLFILGGYRDADGNVAKVKQV
jgi:hypothetical protein